jgi:tetratricopeptide (TPR) repeat protein
MKHRLFVVGAAALLTWGTWACQKATPDAPKVNIVFATLSPEKIYQTDEVKDFIFACEEDSIDQIKEQAKRLFLQGIDAKVNKKNTVEGIALLTKSITFYPDSKTYYELGNALYEQKNYEEAEKAYQMAETLRFSNLANLYYNMALNTAAKGGEYIDYSIADYLGKAIEQGFVQKELVQQEPLFAPFQNSPAFQQLFLKHFTNSEDKDAAAFKVFLRGFPEKTLPYEISSKDVDNVGDKYISYDFANYVKEMETGSFGRDVGSEYYYLAKVKSTEKYVAVVYASRDAMAEEMPPTYSYLVTYTNKGEEISKLNVACQCTPQKIKTAKIEGNKITVTEYERLWQSPITEVPFSENRIKSVAKLGEKIYQIDANGKITENTAAVGAVGTKRSDVLVLK